MSRFVQINCDSCNENTIVTKVDKVELTGPSSGLISSEVIIKRGCFHICVDDKLKEHGVV